MAYYISDTALTAIADAIRAKLGSAAQYTPEQMANTIRSYLRNPAGEAVVTADGTYDVGADRTLRVIREDDGGQLSYNYDPATMMLVVTERPVSQEGEDAS